MRRDICFYFDADVRAIYNAYLAAAKNPVFRRECREEPYHTISFGLNFSMKYNMNGGACTLHFIPYRGGSAVDMRFSLAQFIGARYERYAMDLTNAAAALLGIGAQLITVNVEEFLNGFNKVHHTGEAPSAAILPIPATDVVCANCGAELPVGALFCGKCGTKVETGPVEAAPVPDAVCIECGKTIPVGSLFCPLCGKKQNDE